MLQLNRAERLLVTTMRQMVVGSGLCGGVVRELDLLCGAQAWEVLQQVQVFLQALDRGARRTLKIAPPGWFGPSLDEQRMLAMIGAAQDRDDILVRSLTCWFTRRHLEPQVVGATHALADVLAAHQLRITTHGRVAQQGRSESWFASVVVQLPWIPATLEKEGEHGS